MPELLILKSITEVQTFIKNSQLDEWLLMYSEIESFVISNVYYLSKSGLSTAYKFLSHKHLVNKLLASRSESAL